MIGGVLVALVFLKLPGWRRRLTWMRGHQVQSAATVADTDAVRAL